jgi:FixJ family two-component response regulator
MADLLRDLPVISIIDDDESARNGTKRLVRSMGFDAHAFSSARAFLESEQLSETACVISDVQMPEIGGTQLHDILRADGHKIPVILMTAFHEDKIRDQALGRGAICFLSKPVDGQTLRRCLDAALKTNNDDGR